VYAADNPAEARAAGASPARAGNGALWFGVFAPPIAWSVDELTSIALHFDYCAAALGRTFRPWSGAGGLLVLVGVLALWLSLGAGVVAWRAHAAVGSDTGEGETDVDRRRFMARAGLLACALFSYGIVLRLVASLVLPPGVCGS
jgi:hypothetical protein